MICERASAGAAGGLFWEDLIQNETDADHIKRHGYEFSLWSLQKLIILF